MFHPNRSDADAGAIFQHAGKRDRFELLPIFCFELESVEFR
jgi:hypothetical protein